MNSRQLKTAQRLRHKAGLAGAARLTWTAAATALPAGAPACSKLVGVMRATLVYTLLRIVIFAAVGGILALFGVHGITLIAAALIISAIISLLALSRFRDAMSASIAGRTERIRAGLEAGSKREDAG